ncbi:MAG: hypothetical protein K0S65_524 [Labilithrix sp.]|nr:hypothetical protein [Labilithrix sp.]
MKPTSSRGIGLAIASMVLASSFVACPLLKKKGADAGDDGGEESAVVDAATVGAAGLGAKNEASVLRYANETAIANEPAVIGEGGARARNFPGNGPEVAFLPKGTPVAKIAQYFSTATLIMFDDPSGDGTKLIGWVPPKVFDVAAPAPTKTIVPPVIKVDAGSATIKDAGVTTRDAGVAVKDAGAAPVVDGGGGSSTSTLPQPPKGALAVPPVNGKCPDGWAVAESMCRRKCAADADCPRNTKCATKQGVKVCTSDH